MMHRRTQILALAACAGMAVAANQDQAAHGAPVRADGPTLRLQTGDVQVRSLPAVRTQAGQAAPRRVIVQLNGPMDADRRAAIEASGARILGYVPDNAFVIDTRRARMSAVEVLPFVTAVVAYRDEWKLAPELGARAYRTPEMMDIARDGRLPASVVLFPGADPVEAARLAAGAGVRVESTHLEDDRFVLRVVGFEKTLRTLSAIDDVEWVEPASELTTRSNTNTRWIVQTNQSNSTPFYTAGLRGEGQLIGVIDSPVSVNHCSFSDPGIAFGDTHRKIQAYNGSTGYDLHGTHVAGTALGDAGSNSNTRGVAYNARLVFSRIPSFSGSAFLNVLTLHYGQGATIHTNSWGDDFTTAYNSLARSVDIFSYNNDDNLVIFAVTNGNNLRNPENAKNGLAVGATNGSGGQQNFCTGGQGPTADGRRKPEIFAPGCSTASSGGTSCSTSTQSGTSMAAPAIAGAAALVRQYYSEGFYPSGSPSPEDAFVPSGPLMKATLLNSSVDMTGVAGYPSNREGWGRVLLDNALYLEGQARTNIVRDVRNTDNDALDTGDLIEVPFVVTSNAQELRATLVWHDAPASLNASFTPVNNLDMEIVGPTGVLYRGNVFSGGVSVTGGVADAINNVEMVRLTSPAPGEYTARVRAAGVNVGSQGYALVITGSVEEDNDPGCSSADLAEPYGVLNVFDLFAYLGLYNTNDPAADLAEPDGVINVFDLFEYLNAYNAGCP